MELSPPWGFNSHWATQEIPNILYNQKAYYRVHKALQLVPILSRWIQSIPPPPVSLRSLLILFSHICLGLPSGLLHSGFPTKTLPAFLGSPRCATCSANLKLLNLIILITFGEKYKLWTYSWCIFLHPPAKKLNSAAVVRKRTIPTERLPLVGEISANLCG
jgi:hypothetical protein